MASINCFYIIVAVLNARDSLERCLQSILKQSYQNIKLLVVDGGSDDGTVDILKRYDAAISWWVSEPDKGIYDAWNKALSEVSDGWVLFLGADDILAAPDVIRRVDELLKSADSRARVVYGQVAAVNAKGQILAINGAPWAISGKNFTSSMTLPHQGVFHHSSLFSEFGVFDPRLKIAGDYDFLLKVLPHEPPCFLEGVVISEWAVGGISYNVKTSLQVAHEISEVRRKNDLNSFSFHLTVFYLKAYVLHGLYLAFGERFANRIAGIYRRKTGQWS